MPINRLNLWALGFAANCVVLTPQVGHAQVNVPGVTGVGPQPSRLLATEGCCFSGEAQVDLMLPQPATTIDSYGAALARAWNDLRVQQQTVIRSKLHIPWVPLLRSVNVPTPFQPRPPQCDTVPGWISGHEFGNELCRSALSVSVDPQSKLLNVRFHVYRNTLVRAPSSASCGTFDLELAMVFDVEGKVSLRSGGGRPRAIIRTSNFQPTGRCAGYNPERVIGTYVDAGVGLKLQEHFNSYFRQVAKTNGIRAVRAGVLPENRDSLVFEISPAEVAVPTGG